MGFKLRHVAPEYTGLTFTLSSTSEALKKVRMSTTDSKNTTGCLLQVMWDTDRQEALGDRKVMGACSSDGDDTKCPALHSHLLIRLLYIF